MLKNPFWSDKDIPDCNIMARMGNIMACIGSQKSVEALRNDPAVLRVEVSHPAIDNESTAPMSPLPLLHAHAIHNGPFPERGCHAIIALIDSDIDVLHETFLDVDKKHTRIRGIWDQTDLAGPPPHGFRFGTFHDEDQINRYVQDKQVPAGLKRVSCGHGTHVASIAAGQPSEEGQFAGGVAPEAKLIVVIPSMQVGATDPFSIGYSSSLVAALEFIDRKASDLGLPVVVNLSQGMNAGAHDGTSLVEAAFDQFTGGGCVPGRVVVKSAGNERQNCLHAHLGMGLNQSEVLRWQTMPHAGPDVIELWFKACDEFRFRLVAPQGSYAHDCSSTWIDKTNPEESSFFPNGNRYGISFERHYADNGDSRLLIIIGHGRQSMIESGTWSLDIESTDISSNGEIDAWFERSFSKAVCFTNHLSEDITLTVPGTAHTIISVASVQVADKIQIPAYSSYGPTRDGRRKPDLAAPGECIYAAKGNSLYEFYQESGTSMAAPHVTGAIALLLSYWQTQAAKRPLNAAQIRAALSQTTQNYSGGWHRGMGYGLLNVEKLLISFGWTLER